MQKWEYLEVTTRTYFDPDRPVDYLNGNKYKGGLRFYDLLNQLGDEGWELVAVDQGFIYTFKRPKP